MTKYRDYTLAILELAEVNIRRALDRLMNLESYINKTPTPDIGDAIFQIEKALEYNEFARDAIVKKMEHLEAMNKEIRQSYDEMVEMTEKIINIIDKKALN